MTCNQCVTTKNGRFFKRADGKWYKFYHSWICPKCWR